MSIAELSGTDAGAAATSARRLFLIWQNPSTRKFAQVGALVEADDGTYTFRYLRRAVDLPEFHPLASFPDLHRVYRSAELPPFFGNRVMSPAPAGLRRACPGHEPGHRRRHAL